MPNKSLAIVLGTVILLAVPIVCGAQQAAPGKWIHRTLANAAANEANRRAREIPPGRWWHLPYFVNQLRITEQEKAQLDKLFDYNRNKLVQLKTQMEKERSELVGAIDRQHLDETAALSWMKKLENSRTLLASTRFTYSLEVRKMLGYARFEHLKKLFRNWRGLQEYFSKKNRCLNQANDRQPPGERPSGALGLGKGHRGPPE